MSDSKISEMPETGRPDEWVKQRLSELGLTEDDIGMVVEGSGGLHAQGGRWKICPSCKANIDLLTWVEGQQDGERWPRLLSRGEIECPNCGTYGEIMGDNAMNEPHPKLRTFNARPIHNPYPWSERYVRLGKSIIERCGLFPSDVRLDPNEPHWPRDLGACIVAGALIVASTIKKSAELRHPGGGPPRRPAKKYDRRSNYRKPPPKTNDGEVDDSQYEHLDL